MAKQKKEKLYCDQTVEQNYRLIQILGKVSNADEVYTAVADDYTRHIINKGFAIDQIENVVKNYMDKIETMAQMSGLSALNNWYWGGRQMYRFDKDLAELLYSQTKNDLEVDSKTLTLLPCPHFYISLEDDARQGFFVSYSDDVLYISDMGKDFVFSFGIPVPKNGATLSGIIADTNAEIGNNVTKKQINELSEKISTYMQFIVYLSAVNAEIEPVTKGGIVTRQAGQRVATKHDKTEISNVGYRLGEALRASKKEKANVQYIGDHEKSSPKSPHIRRSHFHSYWTGSGENKELIVKWVNTIFVHGDAKNADITTVHDVMK